MTLYIYANYANDKKWELINKKGAITKIREETGLSIPTIVANAYDSIFESRPIFSTDLWEAGQQ